jgi:hypothetical protein
MGEGEGEQGPGVAEGVLAGGGAEECAEVAAGRAGQRAGGDEAEHGEAG